MVSGEGQVIQEQFTTNAPMVVQARNAGGAPAPGVAVTWSIIQGQGTLRVQGASVTDQNGLASANFLGTGLQPGTSYLTSRVSATSSFGTATFYVTTVPLRSVTTGNPYQLPLVELVAPPLNDRRLSGPA